MNSRSCYQTRHSSALNKISGRLPEGREFIISFDVSRMVSENAQLAYLQRWYGNSSERKCKELTRHFKQRYVLTTRNFKSLRFYVQNTASGDFPWLNHFYMLLDDPYYRWATSEFIYECFKTGQTVLPRQRFDRELKKRLPETVGDGSAVRYGQNLLTAIRDNGLLEGKGKKMIASPGLRAKTLAFMLYTLSDCGAGSNEFDNSPLFHSFCKPRKLLIPLFNEGERSGYWDFTGDHERICFNFNYDCLENWLEACIP
jgi:hypothetical protein